MNYPGGAVICYLRSDSPVILLQPMKRVQSTPSNVLSSVQETFVREFLGQKALEQVLSGAIAHTHVQEFLPLIHNISERYVASSGGGKAIQSEKEAVAYLLYYGTITTYKIAYLLEMVSKPQSVKPFTVLDLGGGPGVTGALFAHATEGPLTYTNVERNKYMRSVSKRLLNSFTKKTFTHFTTHSIPQDEEFDLIIAANVFNELSAGQAEEIFDELISKLSPDGKVLIIDTALQDQTRRLMQFRDLLIHEHGLVPTFPCPHEKPCPMLVNSSTDWCHAEIRWNRPPLIDMFDSLLGFNKHRLKTSVFIFERGEKQQNQGYRIVRTPTKNRLGQTATVCGHDYYGETTLMKRARNENNRSFTKARSFDMIQPNINLGSHVTGDMSIEVVESPFSKKIS
jgi:ubiquinone/menaquinone biosynthesis C-methylase UbiE